MIADFGQRIENGRKVPSAINGEQIFNIFKDKPFGSIFGFCAFEQSNDFKKERASFSGKPSLPARYRNVLTRESARPEVDPRQIGGVDFGNIFSIPFVLLYIVYGAVLPVNLWTSFFRPRSRAENISFELICSRIEPLRRVFFQNKILIV